MKSNLQKAKEKAQKIFNEYIRLFDSYETTGSPWSCICCTCGKETDNLNGLLHASHYYLDSKCGNSTSFDRVNVNASCKRCNRFLSGNLGNYVLFILKKYGQGEMDRLIKLHHETKKWTIEELEEISIIYKEKIKSL